jgi:hypothetical protein
MKLRYGFVSNSSTSSFIIFGTHFENVKELKKAILPEKIKQLEKEVEEENKEIEKKYTWKVSVDDWLKDMCRTYYGDDSLVFGCNVGSIDYIEEIASIDKLIEIKKQTEELFNEWFGKDHKFDIALWGMKAEC